MVSFELDHAELSEANFYRCASYPGADYKQILKSLHLCLNPKRYLEVGVEKGLALAFSKCASIGVDPQFQLQVDVIAGKPTCMLFQCGSDEFFQTQNPRELLGGPIDIAFLDGLHYYEFLLRDFINTEKSCAPNSIILLHDTLPTDSFIARRVRNDEAFKNLGMAPDWWAGDVWKTVMILRKNRPDLVMYGCETGPTGLVAITNLNPASNSLQADYFRIVEEVRQLAPSHQNFSALKGALTMIEPGDFLSHESLSKYFYL